MKKLNVKKFELMKKMVSTVLMFVVILMIWSPVLAAGDPSLPMFGWNVVALSALLGFASPYLTALFTKLGWEKWQKLAVLYVISIVLSVVGGVVTGSVTSAGIKGDGFAEVITTVFMAGKVTYDWLNASVKVVAVATEPKKN